MQQRMGPRSGAHPALQHGDIGTENKTVSNKTDMQLVSSDAIQLVSEATDLVETHVQTLKHYRALVAFLLYFALWNTILLSHTDSSSTFALKTAVESAFFPSEKQFSDTKQAFDWMEGKMLETLFDDPVCGDGRCEAPVEYPAYGPSYRFGYLSSSAIYLFVSFSFCRVLAL
jgi:hypothetical protein